MCALKSPTSQEMSNTSVKVFFWHQNVSPPAPKGAPPIRFIQTTCHAKEAGKI